MLRHGLVWSVVLVSACWLPAPAPARAADKYTDENRPYEFGFTIDGEQHRHEKKDENGLIMGEFGFITADGVYHVTVYATDENGNFKILSMKNLRVKPFPTSPQARALELPPSAAKGGPIALSPAAPPPLSRELPALPKPSPARSCSGCSIPTSTTQAPKQLTDLAVVSRDNEQFPPYPEQPLNTRGRQFVPGENQVNPPQYGNEQSQPGFPPNNQYGDGAPGSLGGNQALGGGINTPGKQPSKYNQQSGQFGQQQGQYSPQSGQFGEQPDYPQTGGQQIDYPQSGGQKPGYPQFAGQQPSQSGSPNDRPNFEARFGEIGPDQPANNQLFGPPPTKPTLISAQMQIVDPNTDIYKRGPGEREGLPTGLNKDDMLQLLYTFNYTVGFHGHHEEGYTNGVKKGYYYVTGRNGVRTRIDYVADDQGFHPKISSEVLDLLSDDVPKPESEKDEKYGLKGYEFKWLYYPPGSRR